MGRVGDDEQQPAMRDLHVLRVCSVFAAPGSSLAGAAARFDPVGGMQNHTAQLTRHLDRQGIAQTVLTSRLAAGAGVRRAGRRTRVHRTGFRLARLRQLWALGATWFVLRRLPDADLVHGHQGEDIAALAIALLAARRRRCPLVVTLHCSLRHTFCGPGARARLLKTVGGLVEQQAVKRADVVITLTPSAAARVVADGKDRAAVRVIPSGVDPALFTPAQPDAVPSVPRPRVVYVGRLAYQKDVATLLEAFGRLGRDDAQLVIVGDGPERARLEAAARVSQQRQRIHFTGFLPHERVPAVLAHSDVLALPSRYEELGSVLLEGMQAGLPIVASAAGGIPDVIEDGRTGRLFPAGDAEALASVLRDLLDAPAHAKALGAQARRRAVRYHWPSLARQVLWTYRDALDGTVARGEMSTSS